MPKHEDIQIANIEIELEQVRQKQKEQNRTVACLFNLVAYVEDSSKQDYIQSILQGIASKFPCRVIIIKKNASATDSIEINVSSDIVGEKHFGVAFDQIIISVSPDQMQRIPFIVIPHLVPDLHTYLLWGKDPSEDKGILPILAGFASRLIFDMEWEGSLQHTSERILQLLRKFSFIQLADINWISISGWRQILYQIFDSSEALEQLNKNIGIQIHYNRQKDFRMSELQSIYLFGWLASRMNWEILGKRKEEECHIFLCASKYQEFTVSICPHKQQKAFATNIVGIDISTNQNCFYSIYPAEDLAKVNVHISSLELCQLPFTLPLANLKKGFPYAQELLFTPSGPHYQGMLEILKKLPN